MVRGSTQNRGRRERVAVMSVIDEIKERLDIVEVISGYVPLQKAGRNYKALCPFHNEKTPSFIVFPDTQSWHCFGACGAGGSVFDFIMKQENMDFAEALVFLAQRAGVSLRPRSQEQAAADKGRGLLAQINQDATDYFHRLLLESAEGERARQYLAGRGLNAETLDAFQIGYALDDWHALEKHLVAKGFRLADILAAGLLIERDDGGHYDRFRGRIIFPIRDIRGRVVGFGGRVLDDSLPKYLNSSQTALFDKSSILYGIDLAKEAIREAGLAVIVEGYMDVLIAHQHGIRNVVASMGTSLTERQLKVLKRLTKKLALALDSDAAGGQGTLRGLETAKQAMDYRLVPVPNWKGFIDYESRLDAEIRIITLPPGRDPDEIIRESPAAWQKLVERSLSIVDYSFHALTRDLDLGTPRGKAEAAARLLPVIAEIGSAVERTHYVQKLARLLKMDEQALEKELVRRPRMRTPQPIKRGGRFSSFPGLTFGLEKYSVSLLLQDSRLLETMNDTLIQLQLAPLGAEDFTQPELRQVFNLVQERWQKGEIFSVEELDVSRSAIEGLYQELMDILEHISSLPDADLALAAGRCALQLRKTRLERQLVELRYLAEDAQGDQDGGAARRWAEMIGQCSREKRRLDEALSRMTVMGHRERTSKETM